MHNLEFLQFCEPRTMPSDPNSSAKLKPGSKPAEASMLPNLSPDEALDEAVVKLAAQAAFLQAFAENVIDEERPIEEVAPKPRGGEIDFGWRAGLSW